MTPEEMKDHDEAFRAERDNKPNGQKNGKGKSKGKSRKAKKQAAPKPSADFASLLGSIAERQTTSDLRTRIAWYILGCLILADVLPLPDLAHGPARSPAALLDRLDGTIAELEGALAYLAKVDLLND